MMDQNPAKSRSPKSPLNPWLLRNIRLPNRFYTKYESFGVFLYEADEHRERQGETIIRVYDQKYQRYKCGERTIIGPWMAIYFKT